MWMSSKGREMEDDLDGDWTTTIKELWLDREKAVGREVRTERRLWVGR